MEFYPCALKLEEIHTEKGFHAFIENVRDGKRWIIYLKNTTLITFITRRPMSALQSWKIKQLRPWKLMF